MKKIVLFVILFLFGFINVKASYVVLNANDNSVIEGNNIHEQKLIASITKVMTAHIVIDNANLNDIVTVGKEINNAHGSSIYLSLGEKITVKDLLYGMMLRSGNDAAIVLANYVGGSVENFVSLMNEEAKKIKMYNTIFYNPTGLDDDVKGNISSAYDMALLTSYAIKNSEFKKIFKTKRYKCKTNLKSYDWHNKNKALKMSKYVTGGKTGYTKKAHRTLITTGLDDDIPLVIVTLDFSDDFSFHVNKYKNIFSNYNNYNIINKSNYIVKDDYYNKKGCTIVLNNNFNLFINKDLINNLSIVNELYKYKKIFNNMLIGKAIIYNKNKIVHEEPLYCKKIGSTLK